MGEPPPHRHPFRHRHRLHGTRDFDAVFQARCRRNRGPLTVLSRPNGRPYSRLGLVVPRRVGPAVTRHRIKRLLREAFRLSQHDLPAGYDYVIVVRPHPPMDLPTYRKLLASAADALHREWQRRAGANDTRKS